MRNITHGARRRLKGRDYGWFVFESSGQMSHYLTSTRLGASRAVTSTQHRALYQGHSQLNWI